MKNPLKIALVALFSIFLAPVSIAENKETTTFTPKQLAPILKNILEKLEKVPGLPAPSLKKPEIKINNDGIEIKGALIIDKKEIGTADFSVKPSENNIITKGKLSGLDWGNLLNDTEQNCVIKDPENTFLLNYDTLIQAFSKAHIKTSNMSIQCPDLDAGIDQFELSGTISPKDMTGRYNAEITLLLKGFKGSSKDAEIDFSSDSLKITLEFSDVYPEKRSKAINYSYARYWPVKFPFLAIPGDLFLYLDPTEKGALQLREILAGYTELKIKYDIKNYKYKDLLSQVHIKKHSGKLNVFKPELVTESEDEIYIRLPHMKSKIKYPTRSSFDLRIKGNPGFRNMAELADVFQAGPAYMLYLQKFLNNYKGASFSIKTENNGSTIEAEGKIESKMDLPLPEISTLIKIRKPKEWLRSSLVIDDSEKEKINACISALDALIDSFKGLAKKNSGTTEDTWHFMVTGNMTDILINGQSVETIILPESHYTPDKCAVFSPAIPK